MFCGKCGSKIPDDSDFCGRCGACMEKSTAERAMVCPQCKNTVYPKICPAVIAAVHDGDVLSVRGQGKGTVTGTGGRSRKDRIFFTAERRV